MFCQKCGTQNEDVARFCANCGETLDLGSSSNQAGAGPAAAPAAGFTPAPDAAKKAPDTKKLVKIAIAAVIAIVVVVLGFNIIKGIFGSDKINYEKYPIVYTKDGDVMVQLAGKANAKNAYSLGSASDISSSSIKVSENGKLIFYGDDVETNGEYDLYYRMVSDKNGKSAKEIDSGVTGYQVAPNGKTVVYRKGGKLYVSNLKKSEQIDKDVESYSIIGNGKYVYYYVAETKNNETVYELYLCKLNMNPKPVMVDDEVELYSVEYKRDKETGREKYDGVLYYEKDEKLFYAKNGKNPKELLDGIDDLSYINGELFAATVKKKTVSEENAFVEVKDEEGNVIDRELAPGIGTEQNEETGEWEYKKYEYTIHTVNGTKTKALEGTFTEVGLYSQVAEKDKEVFVIKSNGKIISVGEPEDDSRFVGVSEDEKYVFAIEDIDTEPESKTLGCGILNRYKLTSSGLGKSEKIAEDVEKAEIYLNGSVLVITRDGEDSIFNVYYKNKLKENIGENVQFGEIEYDNYVCEKAFYFFEDVENGEGTLKRYTFGKNEAVDIDDDVLVSQVEIRSDKMVYYVADWDDSDFCGTLFLKKGNGEPKVVDEEVEGLGVVVSLRSQMGDIYDEYEDYYEED